MPIPASTAPIPFGIDGEGQAGPWCRVRLQADPERLRAIVGMVPWACAHSNADGCEVMPGRPCQRCRQAQNLRRVLWGVDRYFPGLPEEKWRSGRPYPSNLSPLHVVSFVA